MIITPALGEVPQCVCTSESALVVYRRVVLCGGEKLIYSRKMSKINPKLWFDSLNPQVEIPVVCTLYYAIPV